MKFLHVEKWLGMARDLKHDVLKQFFIDLKRFLKHGSARKYQIKWWRKRNETLVKPFVKEAKNEIFQSYTFKMKSENLQKQKNSSFQSCTFEMAFRIHKRKKTNVSICQNNKKKSISCAYLWNGAQNLQRKNISLKHTKKIKIKRNKYLQMLHNPENLKKTKNETLTMFHFKNK